MTAYLIYLFVICIWNAYAGGARMTTGKTWDKIVGVTAILAGILGMAYGFSLIMGVSPIFVTYLIIAPYVGMGLIITADSWYIYKETKSIWVLLLALYNTLVTLYNLILMIEILKNVDWDDVVKLGGAGAAAAWGLSNAEAFVLSLAASLVLSVVVALIGRKLARNGDLEVRKVPDSFRQKTSTG